MPTRRSGTGLIVRAMRAADIGQVLAMLDRCEGIGRRAADSPPALRRYLRRNPRLSIVATRGSEIVACVFAGHDGRRGYLHHVAVHPDHRRAGLGRAVVERALRGLRAAGINKVHCDVFRTNRGALRFWREVGWHRRDDLARWSVVLSDDPNA